MSVYLYITKTYKERNYIRPLVKAMRSTLKDSTHETIIVDNSSPNGTYENSSISFLLKELS